MASYFEYSPADLFRYRVKLDVLVKRCNLDSFSFGGFCLLDSPYSTIFVVQYVPSVLFEECQKLGLRASVFTNAASSCGADPYTSVELWVSPGSDEFNAQWHFDD